MSARALYDLDDWLERRLRRLTLHCRAGADAERIMRHLQVARINGKEEGNPPPCEVDIDYDNGAARCRIGLGGGWRMTANIISALRENPDVTECKLKHPKLEYS